METKKEKTEEEIEIEFKTFKDSFITFIVNEFNICDSFKTQLEIANDYKEIKRVLKRNNDDVYEFLGGQVIDEYEIYDLEDEIKKLEDEIYELEGEIHDFKKCIGNTLNDDYKYNFFFYNIKINIPLGN